VVPFALGPAAAAAGYRLLGFDTVGSTSAEARARARAGERGPLWVAARAQTAGYGRRGRAWQSPSGNLAASLLLTVEASAAEAATLGFVAGLAAAQAIDAVRGAGQGDPVTLKWPNDVLADGAKIAGVLVEAEDCGAGTLSAVIGIGINVVAAPGGLPYAATSLAECGVPVAAETVFAALSDSWEPLAAQWRRGGFPALREAWLARAGGLGAAAAVQQGDRVVRGTFETIDEAGRLVMRAPDGGCHVVAAGEVHFGAAATATAG